MPITIRHEGDIGQMLGLNYLGALGQFRQKQQSRQAQLSLSYAKMRADQQSQMFQANEKRQMAMFDADQRWGMQQAKDLAAQGRAVDARQAAKDLRIANNKFDMEKQERGFVFQADQQQNIQVNQAEKVDRAEGLVRIKSWWPDTRALQSPRDQSIDLRTIEGLSPDDRADVERLYREITKALADENHHPFERIEGANKLWDEILTHKAKVTDEQIGQTADKQIQDKFRLADVGNGEQMFFNDPVKGWGPFDDKIETERVKNRDKQRIDIRKDQTYKNRAGDEVVPSEHVVEIIARQQRGEDIAPDDMQDLAEWKEERAEVRYKKISEKGREAISSLVDRYYTEWEEKNPYESDWDTLANMDVEEGDDASKLARDKARADITEWNRRKAALFDVDGEFNFEKAMETLTSDSQWSHKVKDDAFIALEELKKLNRGQHPAPAPSGAVVSGDEVALGQADGTSVPPDGASVPLDEPPDTGVGGSEALFTGDEEGEQAIPSPEGVPPEVAQLPDEQAVPSPEVIPPPAPDPTDPRQAPVQPPAPVPVGPFHQAENSVRSIREEIDRIKEARQKESGVSMDESIDIDMAEMQLLERLGVDSIEEAERIVAEEEKNVASAKKKFISARNKKILEERSEAQEADILSKPPSYSAQSRELDEHDAQVSTDKDDLRRLKDNRERLEDLIRYAEDDSLSVSDKQKLDLDLQQQVTDEKELFDRIGIDTTSSSSPSHLRPDGQLYISTQYRMANKRVRDAGRRIKGERSRLVKKEKDERRAEGKKAQKSWLQKHPERDYGRHRQAAVPPPAPDPTDPRQAAVPPPAPDPTDPRQAAVPPPAPDPTDPRQAAVQPPAPTTMNEEEAHAEQLAKAKNQEEWSRAKWEARLSGDTLPTFMSPEGRKIFLTQDGDRNQLDEYSDQVSTIKNRLSELKDSRKKLEGLIAEPPKLHPENPAEVKRREKLSDMARLQKSNEQKLFKRLGISSTGPINPYHLRYPGAMKDAKKKIQDAEKQILNRGRKLDKLEKGRRTADVRSEYAAGEATGKVAREAQKKRFMQGAQQREAEAKEYVIEKTTRIVKAVSDFLTLPQREPGKFTSKYEEWLKSLPGSDSGAIDRIIHRAFEETGLKPGPREFMTTSDQKKIRKKFVELAKKGGIDLLISPEKFEHITDELRANILKAKLAEEQARRREFPDSEPEPIGH